MPKNNDEQLYQLYIPDETTFIEKLYLFINTYCSSSAFQTIYPNSHPKKLITLHLEKCDVLTLLSQWQLSPARSRDMKNRIARLCEFEGEILTTKEITAFAELARCFCMPSLSQSLFIQGFNKLQQHATVPLKLNEEGVCSELGGLWFTSRIKGGETLATFFTVLRFVSSAIHKNNLPQDKIDMAIAYVKHHLIDKQVDNLLQVEQYNYRKLYGVDYESSHALIVSNAHELAIFLQQLIPAHNWKNPDTNKLYRFCAQNHTVSLLKLDGQLFFFDTNPSQGDINIEKFLNAAEEMFKGLYPNHDNITPVTFLLTTYPLSVSFQQQQFYLARHAVIELNRKNQNPALSFCLQQYEKGIFSQNAFLQRLRLFFNHPDNMTFICDEYSDYYQVFLQASKKFLSAQLPYLLTHEKAMDKTAWGNSALWAIATGHFPALLHLFQYAQEANCAYTAQEYPILLRTALEVGSKEALRFLLRNGWDINQHFSDGNTPLTFVIRSKYSYLAPYLLSQGADAQLPAQYSDGRTLTPIAVAALCGDTTQINVLLAQGGCISSDALLWAIKSGHANVIRLLFTLNPEFTQDNTLLNTCVIEAAKSGHIEIMYLLHTVGADLNTIQTNAFDNLFQIATIYGHLPLVEYLSAPHHHPQFALPAKTITCNPFRVNSLNSNLLHYAAITGRTLLFHYWLTKNISPLEENSHGKTPLHYAVSSGALDIIKPLFTQNPDIWIGLAIPAF